LQGFKPHRVPLETSLADFGGRQFTCHAGQLGLEHVDREVAHAFHARVQFLVQAGQRGYFSCEARFFEGERVDPCAQTVEFRPAGAGRLHF
jgi:hypothetical protein